jgi:mannose-6-phosphate isomerase
MAKLEGPLQLAPVFKPRLWGVPELAPIYGGNPREVAPFPPSLQGEKIGEAWLTGDDARFRNGPVAGRTLGEVVREYGPELLGGNSPHRRFPILAKFLFTGDWLSVQVHPDDEEARRLQPGEIGKTEMWYVAAAGREGEYLLGLKPGTSAESLRRACLKGKSMERLRNFRARAGEAIFVPAGTIHALGPGLVVFEAEQNSDLTYRLDDFGRVGPDGKPRPLHVKEGLEVARLDAPAHRRLPRLEVREPFGTRRYIVACRFFAVELLTLERCAHLASSPGRVELFSVLSGSGRVENASGWLGFRTGETWLIPPGTGNYRLFPRGKAQLLRCYLPDLDADFRKPLRRRKIKAAQSEKVIFD